MADIKLGFGYDPRSPLYIFVGENYIGDGKETPKRRYLWYSLNDGDHDPIFDPALTGFLTNVKCVRVNDYKGTPSYKYEFHIRADRDYIVRSGVDTLFSRGMIHDLECAAEEDFDDPITIITYPGEAENVVLSRVYFHSRGVSPQRDWDSDKKLFPSIVHIQETLGLEPQTKKSIEIEYAERQERIRERNS